MASGATSSDDDDPHSLVGVVLGHRVELESFVAQGGFGLVFRARHSTFGCAVAVKLLRPLERFSERTQKTIEARFTQEAELIARLEHPGVVRLLDYGVAMLPSGRQSPWMALEWLDGLSLGKSLRQRAETRPYTRAETLAMLRPALQALALAHAQNIAHRDVTPNNLIVVKGPDGPVARLIDFGIARMMEDDAEPSEGNTMTRSAMLSYTRAYVAPEQLSGTRTGPWTDVHGAALVITEMLTGLRPYAGADETEKLARVLNAERPTPAAFGVDAGGWEPVLAKALALRPADRYPHAGALLAALEETLNVGSAPDITAVDRTQPATLPPGAVSVSVGPSPALRDRAEEVTSNTTPTSTTQHFTMVQPTAAPGMSSDALNRKLIAAMFVSLVLSLGLWLMLHAPAGGLIPQRDRGGVVPSYNTTVQVPGEARGPEGHLPLEFPIGAEVARGDAGAAETTPVATPPPPPPPPPLEPANDPRFQVLNPTPTGRNGRRRPPRPPTPAHPPTAAP